jgi:predicted nucleotidyltransferase
VSTNAAVQTKHDILDLLSRNRARLRSLGVQEIGLFGSFVRGEQHSDSDVDLIVKFDLTQKTFDNFMFVATFLEDLLQRKVEIVTTEALSPYIGPHILREAEYVDLAA